MTIDYHAPGLEQPVEILVDQWGIPHIYAESSDDVFFAQGFNAARDRLYQIDLWRRRALGQLAAVFGPSYVDHDRAARLFLFRGDLAVEWASYGPEAQRIVSRFVEGINAYVTWLDDHPEALPQEFEMLGYRPAFWSPEDVVRPRTHAPSYNLVYELYRARVAEVADVAVDGLRQLLEPPHTPGVPGGLEVDLPPEVLSDYLLATQPMETLIAGSDRRAGKAAGEGSNNWVVSGDRTSTGRPLLASDPHRTYATPSLRYIAHLSAPDLDVIGAGEPFDPGIALGHNGTAAFGFTIFTIDSEDLYVCDISTPREHVTELLDVRGEGQQEISLEFTRHGPVLHVDEARQRVYVLRSTWSEPGTAPYLGSSSYLRARSWEEFSAALSRWRYPGENHVYADVHGTIAWQAAGLAPRRRRHDGLLPVPTASDDHWDGFLTHEELPGVVDPPEGFVATANEFNISEGLPPVAYEWPDAARKQRITEVLAAGSSHSIEDMKRLQTDQLSKPAQEILTVLQGIEVDDPKAAEALDLLRDWDAVVAVDSAAAALYEIWVERHLGPAFLRLVAPASAVARIGLPDRRVLRTALTDPARGLAREARDKLVCETLRDAFDDAVRLLGDQPASWRWGTVHQNIQPHTLGHLDPRLHVGPAPVGGSHATVNAAAYWPDDFSPAIGASFRMIVDVGEWDNSLCINTPGQSGDCRSPHYRDLFDTWRQGGYVPLLYSRAAVEEHTTTRIRIDPSPEPDPPRPATAD